MKKSVVLFAVFFIFFAANAFSQQVASLKSNIVSEKIAKYKIIEGNYLSGLSSDVHHLKVSCAYFLGDIKSQKALIPLMKMFRTEKDPGAKLVAAWSLLKIGDPRGVYLVKSSINNNEYKTINSMLSVLYNDYCLKNFGRIDKN